MSKHAVYRVDQLHRRASLQADPAEFLRAALQRLEEIYCDTGDRRVLAEIKELERSMS